MYPTRICDGVGPRKVMTYSGIWDLAGSDRSLRTAITLWGWRAERISSSESAENSGACSLP